MTLKVARRAAVAPFIVMEILRAANERGASGADVIHMEVGQPGTGAPAGVIEAVRSALGASPLGYTEALGLPALRQRIARHYAETYGIEVDPGRIAVTTGSSAGFLLSFLASFDAGDRVVLTDPSYPCYRNILSALGVEPVHVAVGPESHFQPSPEILSEIGGTVAGLVVASPSNPTGSMLSPAALEAIVDHCRERGIRLISDEIYHGITFGTPAQTVLAYTDDAIVINSFSKYFSMTGWRLGWMVLPPDLAPVVERLAQNLFISAPTVSQIGGIAAFDCGDELKANLDRYAANRALLLTELPRAGIDRFAPADGAFYVYADIAGLTNDAAGFCRDLLMEAGVATTPGIDFDAGRGNRYLRLSYAGTTEDVAEAAARMARWLRP